MAARAIEGRNGPLRTTCAREVVGEALLCEMSSEHSINPGSYTHYYTPDQARKLHRRGIQPRRSKAKTGAEYQIVRYLA
jgi:hypothetical protein